MTENRRQRSAFTMVELLVAIAVLTLLLYLIHPVFTYSRKVDTTMKRLDSYHHARRVDQEVASEIKFASAIVFPPDPDCATDVGPWFSQVVFQNSLHQVFGLFVDEKGRLVLYNFDTVRSGAVAPARVLARNVKEFSVRRHGSALLEYQLRLEQEKHEFTATNRLTLLNVL